MGRGGRDSAGHRGGKGYEGHGVRGSNDNRWEPETTDHDLYHDLRDMYEDLPDPVTDEYMWPQNEDEDED